MKKNVLNKSNIQKEINKDFIFLEVNVDFINLPFGLKKHFKGITPTFFFLTQENKLLSSYPGAWKEKDFINILKENSHVR